MFVGGSCWKNSFHLVTDSLYQVNLKMLKNIKVKKSSFLRNSLVIQWLGLSGYLFEQALGNSEGQGSLACCSPWSHKELDMIEWLNNNNAVQKISGMYPSCITGTSFPLTNTLTFLPSFSPWQSLFYSMLLWVWLFLEFSHRQYHALFVFLCLTYLIELNVYHQLNGHEFEQAPEVGDGQGNLACCSLWGRKESNMTERLNWTDWMFSRFIHIVTNGRISFF